MTSILHFARRAFAKTRRRFPDFLCIGAQRSGTTWLYRNLLGHPGLWLPPFKELHYFDQRFGDDRQLGPRLRLNYLRGGLAGRNDALAAGDPDGEARRWLAWAGPAASCEVDDAWYEKLFSPAPAAAKTGEITPAYAVLPENGVRHVKRLMPGLRIVFLMRDPAERLVSGAVHYLTGTGGNSAPSLDELIKEMNSERCRGRSCYPQTITIWERHFPADRFHYAFFDDIKERPSDVLEGICAHLGVDDNCAQLPSLTTRFNANIDIQNVDLTEAYDYAAKACRNDIAWLYKRFGRATRWLKPGK